MNNLFHGSLSKSFHGIDRQLFVFSKETLSFSIISQTGRIYNEW